MTQITYHELCEQLYEYNKEKGFGQFKGDRYGVVVYKAENWKDVPYTEAERTYVFNCAQKALMPNMGGNSIFANCIGDKAEQNIRLDWYDWEADYCYNLSAQELADYVKEHSVA